MKGKKLTRGEAVECLIDGKSVYVGKRIYGHYRIMSGEACRIDENSWWDVAYILTLANDYRNELYEWVPDPEPGHDFNWALEQALEGKSVVWSDGENEYQLTMVNRLEDGKSGNHYGVEVRIGEVWYTSCMPPADLHKKSYWRLEK